MVARRSTAGRTLECLGQCPAGVCGVGTPWSALWELVRRRSSATIKEKGVSKDVYRLHGLRAAGSRDSGARAFRADGPSVGAAYIFGRSGIEYDQAQVTLAG